MTWTTRTLGEICDEGKGVIRTGPFGSQLHESDYSDEGTPVVMPKDIIEGKVSESSIARVNDEHLERLAQHKLLTGDIVYGRRGDIGRQALITRKESGWLCGTGCLRISLGNSQLDAVFLHYFLRDARVIDGIAKQAVGATMPNLNTSILRSIPITYPPVSTQCRIAAILSAYDDLIGNNTRRTQILEEMARRMYEEWFVQFRFPGHKNVRMVETTREPLPENWSINSIVDFGRVVTGKTPSKRESENFGFDVPFLKLPDMHGRLFCIDTSEKLSNKGAASQSSKFIPANSLCVSCIGTAGIVNINAVECQTNQQINSLIPNEVHNREYLYFALIGLEGLINQYGANGATMVNLNKTKFESLPVIQPTEKVLKNYHQVTYPLFQQILNLQRKNNVLRSTRDLLLPKLISGEIDVSNFLEPVTD